MPPNPGRIRAASWRGSRQREKASISRYVVTDITDCGPEWLYGRVYCARGQAENPDQAAQGPTHDA
jgi:hypothetical protein